MIKLMAVNMCSTVLFFFAFKESKQGTGVKGLVSCMIIRLMVVNMCTTGFGRLPL